MHTLGAQANQSPGPWEHVSATPSTSGRAVRRSCSTMPRPMAGRFAQFVRTCKRCFPKVCGTQSLGMQRQCNRSWRPGRPAKGAPTITIETTSCYALGRLSPAVLLAHPGAPPTPEAQTSPLASATHGFKQQFSPASLGPMSPAAAEVKISTTQRHAPVTR